MKLTTRIRNILFLRKILRGSIKSRDVNYKQLLYHGFESYRDFRRGGFERSLVAAAIKKLRKHNPYEIKGWAEAEKAYKEYLSKDRSIKDYNNLKEGDYLTRISYQSPIKGDKPFEYHVNQSWSVGEDIPYTIKLTNKNKKYGYFDVEESSFGEGVDRDDYTSYLYATDQEIERYEQEKSRRQEIQIQIDKKQEEIEKLYKEKNSI